MILLVHFLFEGTQQSSVDVDDDPGEGMLLISGANAGSLLNRVVTCGRSNFVDGRSKIGGWKLRQIGQEI